MTPGPARYILVCDYGSGWTKATLFGTVDGVRRLVATRSFPTPTLDGFQPDLDAATVQSERAMRELTGVQGSDSLEDRQDDLRVRLVPVGSSAPPMSVVLVCVHAKAAQRLADQIRAASYIGEIRAGSIAGLLSPWTIRDGYRPDLVLLVEGRTPLTPAQQKALDRLLTRLGADTQRVPVLHCVPEGVESGATTLQGRTETDTVRCDLLARSLATRSGHRPAPATPGVLSSLASARECNWTHAARSGLLVSQRRSVRHDLHPIRRRHRYWRATAA